MIYLILISAYVWINAFFAGWCLSQGHRWWNILLAIVFGSFALCWALLLAVLSFTWERTNYHLQLSFFWQFHFTDRWDKLVKHDIVKLNNYVASNKKSNSIHDMIQRYCMNMINKKHKYIPH